ncbi:MAG: HEAT repeat domain-containing protein [Myxococcota bacterium]
MADNEQQPVEDLSAFDTEEPMANYAMGSDDQAIRKIRRRSSPATKIVVLLLVALGGVIGFFMWQSSVGVAEQEKAVNECGQRAEAEVPGCLAEVYPTLESEELQLRVLRNLNAFGDTDAGDLYVKALEVKGPVRRHAAIALSRIGPPGPSGTADKLRSVLDDTDHVDRTQVVWALAVFGDGSVSDEIIAEFTSGRFQEQVPDFDPKVVSDVLGADRLSSEELLNHDEVSVRLLTAVALAENATPAVVSPLSRLIELELGRSGDDQSPEVVRAAAAGLGRTGDPAAASPLFSVLQQQPLMRDGVIDALRKSTGATEIATLLGQAQDVDVKRELVRLLAEQHDDRVKDTLAGLLGEEDEEIRLESSIALAEMGDDRSVPALVAFASGEDDSQSDRALKALQALGAESAAAPLLEALPSSCPDEPDPEMPAMCFRQAGFLRAIGASGGPDAGRRLETALSGVDGPVAAVALAKMNYEPAYSALLGKVVRPRDVEMAAANAAERSLENEDLLRARRGAIQAMGYYGNPDAVDELMEVVEDIDDDYELRALAGASIGMAADTEAMQAVMSKVQDSGTDENARRYYVQALWQKPHPDLTSSLLDLMANAEAPSALRRSAALAVGYSADDAANARLIEMLGAEETRTVAVYAIALGGSAEAAEAAVAALPDDNRAKEDLQAIVMSDQTDYYNLLTHQMFESGQVWRRIEASKILAEGNERGRYGYTWLKTLAVLRSGWNGIDGVSAAETRAKLWEGLTSEDPARRALVADVLGQLPERGLLLRARDSDGPGSEEARAVLRDLNRPQTSS